jgi:flagellar protein FliO/FliZ
MEAMNRLRLFSLSAALLSSSAFAAETAVPGANVPSQAGNLMQVLFGLIAVLALMALAAWLLRRFNVAKGLGGASIRVIGAVSVGNRERVVVVEVADQWIVVGVAPGSVNALTTMPRQETGVDEAPAPARNFSSWLAHTIEKRNGQ